MTEEKKIIINEVKNSGLISEPTQPKDYNANDGGMLVKEVPGKVIAEENEKPMGGIITPLIPPTEIFSDGHGHLEYQGTEMMQFNPQFDSYSCVLWAIAKATCYNLKERYNITIDIEEMYNAFYAGVYQGRGTTIHNGMESFRLHGWTEYGKFPGYQFNANTTLRQFQSQPPQIVIKDALGQLTKWKFNWEVLPTDHNSIINALKRTVVVVTGFAWASYLGEEGVYYDYNNPANHAFIVADYKDDKSLIVDDSYPQDNVYDTDSTKQEFIKTLAPSYNIASAHRVWLEPMLNPPKNNSIMNIIKCMFNKITRSTNGGLLFIKDGKKQIINDWLDFAGAVIDEVGCKTLKEEDIAKLPDFQFFGK